MIRTTAVPRSLRVSAAAASVAGLVLLAGCSSAAEAEEAAPSGDATAAAPQTSQTGSADTSAGAAGGEYTDGEYTAEGSYQTPEGPETITVTVTLAADAVTAVEVVGEPTRRESQQYQADFIGGIEDLVVGKPLDEVEVDRVGGSSLTSGGFNAAIEEIRTDAAA